MEPDGSGPVRAHVRITGRVHGVGFRVAIADEAEARGVSGWVRNLAGGVVEAVFEGPSDAVQTLVAWCRQGPAGAIVRDFQAEWSQPPAGLAGFQILPTERR